MRLFLHELRNQQRLFWRNRESAVFVFIFPPMLFLLLGAVYTGESEGFKLGINYGGELGFDWHLKSLHHSLGVLGGARLYPS